MHGGLRCIGAFILGLSIVAPAHGQNVAAAIERAAKAYDIEALEEASTLRLESEIRLPFESHDYSSDFHELTRQRFHIILDVEGQRGSHEFLTRISQTTWHGRTFYKDGIALNINYGPDTYQEQSEADFFVEFGGAFRSSDVLLALWMHRNKSEARYLGEAVWLGDVHDIVEVDFPSSLPLRVFVRSRDGAITKMERNVPDGRRVFYTFSSHEKSGTRLIAREHSFYIEDQRIYFSFDQNIVVDDPNDEGAFELDDNIVPEPARTDQSEMAVRNIIKRGQQTVHQVGQGENVSTFMVMGDGVVGFGLSAGLAERLEAYRKESGVKLPLKFMIAADHHDEDIGGAADATAAGATLVVTEHTVLKLRGREVDHALDVVTDEKTIEGLTILPLATDHAATTLVAYHKAHKIVIQTGHYYSSFIDGPSYARRTAVTLYEALPRKIRDEAKTILSGQDLKPEKWTDFVSAIEEHVYIRCHRNRPICGVEG